MAALATTYSCKNMTFEEAYEALTTGVPINVKLCDYIDGSLAQLDLIACIQPDTSTPYIVLCYPMMEIVLYWTSSGISTTNPAEPS